MQTSYRQMVVIYMRGLFRYISCMHSSSYNHNTLTTLITCEGIGVGTGGAGPSQYFTLETLLIFIHAAQIAATAVYITFGPPQNGITSYAYGGNYLVALRPWKFLTATLKCIFTDVHAYMHIIATHWDYIQQF